VFSSCARLLLPPKFDLILRSCSIGPTNAESATAAIHEADSEKKADATTATSGATSSATVPSDPIPQTGLQEVDHTPAEVPQEESIDLLEEAAAGAVIVEDTVEAPAVTTQGAPLPAEMRRNVAEADAEATAMPVAVAPRTENAETEAVPRTVSVVGAAHLSATPDL
jgi:hypothetical protein